MANEENRKTCQKVSSVDRRPCMFDEGHLGACQTFGGYTFKGMYPNDEWLSLAKRAQELSDNIREALGQPSVANQLTPDGAMYVAAMATLFNVFSRTVPIDLQAARVIPMSDIIQDDSYNCRKP